MAGKITDTEDQGLQDWKTVLGEFNSQTGGRGNILQSEVCHMMQQLGVKATQEEVEKLLEEKGCKGRSVSFDDFMEMFNQIINTQHFSEEELLQAFKVFDKDSSGYIEAAKLCHVMSELGDKLSSAELEDLVLEADTTGQGRIYYADFVKTLLK